MADEQQNIRIVTSVDNAAAILATQKFVKAQSEIDPTVGRAGAAIRANAADYQNLLTQIDRTYKAFATAPEPAIIKTREMVTSTKSLKDGLQGVASIATMLEPSFGRYVAILNTLKVAQQGVSGTLGNFKTALLAIAKELANPVFLAGAATFGLIAYGISSMREEAARAAAEQKEINQQISDRIDLERALRAEISQRQRSQSSDISTALDKAGALNTADPKEQERRLLGVMANVRATTAAPTEDITAAVVMAELKGFSNDLVRIREIVNTMQIPLRDGKEMTVDQADMMRGQFRQQASDRASARLGSTVGDIAREEAFKTQQASDFAGAQGSELQQALKRRTDIMASRAAFEQNMREQDSTAGTTFQEFVSGNAGNQAFDARLRSRRMIQERLDALNQSEIANEQQIKTLESQTTNVQAGIYVAPGGSATIYQNQNPFSPGANGFKEGAFRQGAD